MKLPRSSNFMLKMNFIYTLPSYKILQMKINFPHFNFQWFHNWYQSMVGKKGV